MVAIVTVLASLLVPSLTKARAQAHTVACRSNLHQLHVAIEAYGNINRGWYPLEPFECNPHPDLIRSLQADRNGLLDAMYCPTARQMEPIAQDTTNYPPVGLSTSIIDTAENRRNGYITYLYWSFRDRSLWRTPVKGGGARWTGDMDSFRPRALRQSGRPIPYQPTINAEGIEPDLETPCELLGRSPSEFWVISGFWRKKAPFPHLRKSREGVNVLYLDGHGDLMVGQPRAEFR